MFSIIVAVLLDTFCLPISSQVSVHTSGVTLNIVLRTVVLCFIQSLMANF